MKLLNLEVPFDLYGATPDVTRKISLEGYGTRSHSPGSSVMQLSKASLRCSGESMDVYVHSAEVRGLEMAADAVRDSVLYAVAYLEAALGSRRDLAAWDEWAAIGAPGDEPPTSETVEIEINGVHHQAWRARFGAGCAMLVVPEVIGSTGIALHSVISDLAETRLERVPLDAIHVRREVWTEG